MVTDAFQGNYALTFHCFLVYLKTALQLILLGISFVCMCLSFLMIFNKIKGANPLQVPLKTMKIIVKKRIEFLKIILGDNI
jgi:hypothetical protein